MAKKSKDSTEQERAFGVILEDMRDKFQIIVEATKPIPKMQTQINHMLTWEEDIKTIPAIREQVGKTTAQIARILTWEEDIKLIPAIFEEVGALRRDVEILQEAFKLLGWDKTHIEDLEKRIQKIEEKIR